MSVSYLVNNEKSIPTNTPTTKVTLTVPEVASILRIGRCKAYELVGEGVFPTIKVGRSIRIPAERFYQWLENQQQ